MTFKRRTPAVQTNAQYSQSPVVLDLQMRGGNIFCKKSTTPIKFKPKKIYFEQRHFFVGATIALYIIIERIKTISSARLSIQSVAGIPKVQSPLPVGEVLLTANQDGKVFLFSGFANQLNDIPVFIISYVKASYFF